MSAVPEAPLCVYQNRTQRAPGKPPKAWAAPLLTRRAWAGRGRGCRSHTFWRPSASIMRFGGVLDLMLVPTWLHFGTQFAPKWAEDAFRKGIQTSIEVFPRSELAFGTILVPSGRPWPPRWPWADFVLQPKTVVYITRINPRTDDHRPPECVEESMGQRGFFTGPCGPQWAALLGAERSELGQ